MTTDALTLTFSALADPTRRAILQRLSEGEASVSELTAPFDISMPAISRHVKVLEEQLGIQLFRRQPQGVELTTQGKTLRFRQVSRQLAVRRVVGVDEPF